MIATQSSVRGSTLVRFFSENVAITVQLGALQSAATRSRHYFPSTLDATSAQTLETLEFPKILERLARHTSSRLRTSLRWALLPSTDVAMIQRALALTSEARRLLDERPDTTIGGARRVFAARWGWLAGAACSKPRCCWR
ncbi:MAG: hypothetical protein U0074_00040 [Kouleothrix sp.]